ATVTVTVNATQDVPVAGDDVVATAEDTAVTTGNVLANDTDPDGDTLSVDSFTQGANGSVSYNADGTFTYTPHADFNGTDTFTYTVDDGQGNTDTATVTVTVNAVQDAPILEVESTVAGVEGTPIPLEMALSLVDIDDSEVVSVTISGLPRDASLSAGTDQGLGTWTLELADLEDLTLMSPQGTAGEFRLIVEATATDASGVSAIATEAMVVTVEAIGRPVSVPPADDEKVDWRDDEDLRILDPGQDGNGVE
ncbi:MAG: tandem-95 repeat protein, partial [Actinomycetia bacterium]|nr:tandem-95 repeat protein [Actinomycetes bacterium]